MAPRSVVPAANGPSNFTPNHLPNSSAFVSAAHTRALGALNRTFFSIRSVAITAICNLLVAYSTRRPAPYATSWLRVCTRCHSSPAASTKRSARDSVDDRLRLIGGNHEAIVGGQVAVAHVDVRVGNCLKDARCRAGFVGHGHERHVLLLHDAKSG